MGEREDKLVRMFRSDSKIMLATLSSAVSELDSGERSPELLDRAFRAAHSIKSEAGFLHLTEIAESAHSLEDSLSVLRDPDVEISGMGTLRRQFEELSDRIADYLTGRQDDVAGQVPVAGPQDSSLGVQRGVGPDGSSRARAAQDESDSASGLSASGRSMLREAKLRGELVYRVVVRLESVPELRYPRAFLVVNNLEIVCAVVSMEPSLSDMQQNGGSQLTLLVTTGSGETAIRRAVAVDEVELVELTRLSFEELIHSPGERTAATGDSGEGSGPSTLDADLREELGLIADEISRLSGVVAELDLSEDGGRRDAHEYAAQLARMCRVLRERVDWSSRVQLLDVFRELQPKAVSYAARQGKRIRFDVSGNGAVVFGPIADTLTDAVLHLVRNSIEHGIGTIGDRAAMGKPPAGRLTIRVDKVAEDVRVVVDDDGVGVDEDRVRALSGDSVMPLEDILLATGFTTRATPDEGSGRGVGLDTVRHAIRDLLSGSLRMRNLAGKGFSTEIVVPLRNRLTRVLVVESPDGPAAVPAALVSSREIIDLRRVKRDSFSLLYYDHRGESIPIVSVTGSSPSLESISDGATGLVVRVGARHCLMAVDRIVGEESVVRDFRNSRRVFTKTLATDVAFVFPPSLMG